MPWAAAGAVAAAGIGYAGSKESADAGKGAGNKQLALQREQYQQDVARVSPWSESGVAANKALQSFIGVNPDGSINYEAEGARPFSMADFTADPGYAFRMQQGQEAIANKASALGGTFSGGTLKALNDYGQGMGSQEFNNAYSRWLTGNNNMYTRLNAMSGSGLNAAGQQAGLGANAGQQMSATLSDLGNIDMAGIAGQYGAIGNGLSGAYNAYQQQQILNSYQNPGGGYQDLNYAGMTSDALNGMNYGVA